MFWRQCRFRIIRMVCILILIYIMLTRRRSYKRYVHKGGTKTKRNDIIDTSELEKPKVFSIQDVHNLFFKNKEESKTEYKDENQDEIDEYVANSMVDYGDEIENQPLSEENQLNLEQLAIKSDSEEEDENADSIENLRNLVADVLSEEALAAANKELKEESEEAEKQRQKNAEFFHKVFVASTKEEELMNQAYIGKTIKSNSDKELIDRYNWSEKILFALEEHYQKNENKDKTQLERDNSAEIFKRFQWINNYSTVEIYKRFVEKLNNKGIIQLLDWLNDTTNENKTIPHYGLKQIFKWGDRKMLINIAKHEKYTREMKEIPTSEDMNILFDFMHAPEHKKEMEKTHLTEDIGLLTAIWHREYKNKFFKEELAKGRRYEDILDQLQSDLRPSGFEESKEDSDEEMYA